MCPEEAHSFLLWMEQIGPGGLCAQPLGSTWQEAGTCIRATLEDDKQIATSKEQEDIGRRNTACLREGWPAGPVWGGQSH